MARNSNTGRRLKARAYVVIFLLIAILVLVVVLRFNAPRDVGLDARSLPFGPGTSHGFSDRGVVYIIDNRLYYDDLARGKANWSLDLTGLGFKVAAGEDFIVIYSDNMVQALNYQGQPLTNYMEFNSQILEARVGKNMFALLRQDSAGNFAISMISSTGEQLTPLDEKLLGNYVLDFAYYNGDKLWVMMMNTSTNAPVTTINTYERDDTLTGMISLQDELVSGVYTGGQRFYVSGTYRLHMYSTARKEEGSLLTFGWDVLDQYNGDGRSYFLLRSQDALDPTGKGGEGKIITLPEDTTPVEIRFPDNCVDAFIQNGKVVMIMSDSVRVLNLDGSIAQTISLDIVTEAAFKATDSRLILESGGKYYWMTFVS